MKCTQGLLQGAIAEKCPLGDVSEEAMKEREVREGLEVELHRRLPCSVSFMRGQERSVHFAIVGLPQVRHTLHIPVLWCTFEPVLRWGLLALRRSLQAAMSTSMSCECGVHQIKRVPGSRRGTRA